MKTTLCALAAAVVFAAQPALAQPRSSAVGAEVEAMVTVVSVDMAKRIVVFRGPQGGLVEMQVPKEAQNLDQVKPGAVFRVKYAEAVAVTLSKGGMPSKGVEETVKGAPKGANPGGIAVRTAHVSGVVESIDAKNRYVALRGPKQTVSLKIADDVNLSELQVGDRVTIAYTQALAMEMVPQPKKPAAKKKAEK